MLLRPRILVLLVLAFAVMASAPVAFARGGNYSFDGGTSAQRAQVGKALNARSFDWGIIRNQIKQHSDDGCERFASTVAWAYWQNGDNCMKPASKYDESAGMTPAAFRATLARLLDLPSLPLRSSR